MLQCLQPTQSQNTQQTSNFPKYPSLYLQRQRQRSAALWIFLPLSYPKIYSKQTKRVNLESLPKQWRSGNILESLILQLLKMPQRRTYSQLQLRLGLTNLENRMSVGGRQPRAALNQIRQQQQRRRVPFHRQHAQVSIAPFEHFPRQSPRLLLVQPLPRHQSQLLQPARR